LSPDLFTMGRRSAAATHMKAPADRARATPGRRSPGRYRPGTKAVTSGRVAPPKVVARDNIAQAGRATWALQ